MKQPTPEEIKAARTKARLLQADAAALVHASAPQRWQEWETGKYKMSLATWELFLLKTGQHVPE